MVDDDVTRWIAGLADGDDDAAQAIWEKYFDRLVHLARGKLEGLPRRSADEEDVALSAMNSFCQAMAAGRYPQLRDRDDLWKLLVTYTVHKVSKQFRRQRAQKRGGSVEFVELDALEAESRFMGIADQTGDPDLLFDRQWAIEIVTGALNTLRDEMTATGNADQFEALKGSLTGEEGATRGEIAERLGMSQEALKVAVHRLRRRYRDLLRKAVAETVSSEADLDEEMRYLLEVLRQQ